MRTEPTALEPLLTLMLRRMMHEAWYRQESYESDRGDVALGRVALGFVDAAPQPAQNEDGAIVAVMAGEVYDYARQRRALEKAGHRFHGSSQAELLIHGYEHGERKFFAQLNGAFAAALWDGRRRELVLVNDRFGMKPLHYALLRQGIAFGSEIKSLLAHPEISRRVDRRALAQFLTFGQMLGEGTLFEGVRLLPAGGWLIYHANTGSCAQERYFRMTATEVDTSAGESEHLERIDAAFKQAVDLRTQGTRRLGLSLSGGLDARTILGVIEPECPLQTITMGMPGSIDHRAAAQLARLAGRPHHSYFLNTEFLNSFEDHLRRMVYLTDGQYLSQCIVMPTLPIYRDKGVQVLLRGHAGELMHMDKAYNFSLDAAAFDIRDRGELEGWLTRRLACHMSREMGDRLFAASERVDDLARTALRECLAESEGIAPPVHRIAHLFIHQRLRRETALSMVKFGSVVETRLPYLDNGVVEALLAAPPRLKMSDRIQRFILQRRMPEFVNVVNANTGARLGAGRLRRSFAGLRMKVLAKLGVPGYQPYERLGLWLRVELRTLVERLLLAPRFLERGYFNPQTVRTVVDEHLNRGKNHTFLLMALMIFETGQQQFVDGSAAAAPATGPAPSIAQPLHAAVPV